MDGHDGLWSAIVSLFLAIVASFGAALAKLNRLSEKQETILARVDLLEKATTATNDTRDRVIALQSTVEFIAKHFDQKHER